MWEELEHGPAIRSVAPIASVVDGSSMREFLLLPAYAASGVLAIVAVVFAAAGALIAAAVLGSSMLVHAALVQLGLRSPAMPGDQDLWRPHDG